MEKLVEYLKVDKSTLRKYEHKIGGFLQKGEISDNVEFSSKNSIEKTFFYSGKLMYKPKKTAKEVNFYASSGGMFSSIPRFFGLTQIDSNEFLVLENLTYGFKQPNVMDVKIGIVSYDPLASKAKIEYEEKKCKYQKKVGFRITGMRLYDNNKGLYIKKYDKHWGRSVKEGELVDAFGVFTKNGNSKIIENIRKKVENILKEMKEKKYLMVSTSLLIVYEGLKKDNVNVSDDVTVKVIDFDHVFVAKDYPKFEDGFLLGLRSLKEIFNSLEKKL